MNGRHALSDRDRDAVILCEIDVAGPERSHRALPDEARIGLERHRAHQDPTQPKEACLCQTFDDPARQGVRGRKPGAPQHANRVDTGAVIDPLAVMGLDPPRGLGIRYGADIAVGLRAGGGIVALIVPVFACLDGAPDELAVLGKVAVELRIGAALIEIGEDRLRGGIDGRHGSYPRYRKIAVFM